MDRKSRSVKIHQGEMESLLNLKALLDQNAAVISHAEQYQQLGWDLKVLKAQDGANLEVSFDEAPETWVNRLWQSGLSGAKINMGLRTGQRSKVVALEVLTATAEDALDQYGPWRSECVATLGKSRERHFYAWSPEVGPDAPPVWETAKIRWFGEGQVVPVPPSFGPEMQEQWYWRSSPWESPPPYPSRYLLDLLQHRSERECQPWPEINHSWQEMYCLASPHEPLLKALSASYPKMEDYYQGIVNAAAGVGIKAPEVLLSLLWHAPRVSAPQHPEIWDYLSQLAAAAQAQPGRAAAPEAVPWEMFLDQALSAGSETAGAVFGLDGDEPGSTGFLHRGSTTLTHSRNVTRAPFSCRNFGKSLSNV